MVQFIIASLVLVLGPYADAAATRKISVPAGLSAELKSFEPSGALYLEDLDLFLLASDDTTEEDDPMLFLMDRDGKVAKSPIAVQGVEKMTDIESISRDDAGAYYLLSSQGLNKNGKEKSERGLFVRASRTGKQMRAADEILLRPKLLAALEKSKDAELKKMRSSLRSDLDVESHFVRDGELYLGLKEPQPRPGTAVVVMAGNVDAIFENEKLNVRVWKTIDFAAVSGEEDLLSEMVPDGHGHLILATTQEEGVGRLWRFDEATDELTLLEEFDGKHPEGVALVPNEAGLVVFDEGDDDAEFARFTR